MPTTLPSHDMLSSIIELRQCSSVLALAAFEPNGDNHWQALTSNSTANILDAHSTSEGVQGGSAQFGNVDNFVKHMTECWVAFTEVSAEG